jgi:hypothetical protein
VTPGRSRHLLTDGKILAVRRGDGSLELHHLDDLLPAWPDGRSTSPQSGRRVLPVPDGTPTVKLRRPAPRPALDPVEPDASLDTDDLDTITSEPDREPATSHAMTQEQ